MKKITGLTKVTKSMYIKVYGKEAGTKFYNLAQDIGKKRYK